MASTSLQVLYFRSLKASKVLKYLTQYLFQYRSVSIPRVGTLQIIQHPPQLNVVDKLILPPTFSVALRPGEDISDHQLQFLDANLNKGRQDILQDLQFFGDKLHEKINGPGFTWEGLGTITRSTQSLPLTVEALEPVPAERVIRQDARHKILVGDHQRLSGQNTDAEIVVDKASKKSSIFIIIGWVLLLLSILVIVFLLYTGKFRVNASGSKQSPTSYQLSSPPAQNG